MTARVGMTPARLLAAAFATAPFATVPVAAAAVGARTPSREAEAAAQSWKTFVSSRQPTGEEQLRVRVSYGAGALTLRRGGAGALYRLVLRYDEESAQPLAEYRDGRLRAGTSKADGRGIRFTGFGDRTSQNALDLELGTDVPLELDLAFGAGEAELDLTGLPVRELEVSTGASESMLRIDEVNPERMGLASFKVGVADFRVEGLGNLAAEEVRLTAGLGSVTLGLDGEWPVDARLILEMGLGALSLRAPEDLGVQVRAGSNFLASLDLEGLEKQGDDVHRSANWERAERRIDVEVSAALGSIELVRIP